MTVEIATLFIKEENEADFVAAFKSGAEILLRQPGCSGLRWGKRVEPELAFMLAVDWTTIQDHFNFRETEDYKTFGGLIGGFFAKPPEIFHFDPQG